MQRRLTVVAAAVLLLSACNSPTDPTSLVCHVDDQGHVSLISVAISEVAGHLAHGDALAGQLATAGATFSASNTWDFRVPARAFDGNYSTNWNAGAPPTQWIEIDFGSPQRFSAMTVKTDQWPSGFTRHNISLDGAAGFSWAGQTGDQEHLFHSFDTMQTARRVRITTTDSPSWVAWYEIMILGCK